MTYRIFISYRRDDTRGFANAIHSQLKREFGEQNVFMDASTIQPGEDFPKALNMALSNCDVVLVLIGKMWLNMKNDMGTRRLDDPKDFVRAEIAYALEHEKKVIPVLLEGANMPQASELPENIKSLSHRQAFKIGDVVEDDVKKLIRNIGHDQRPSRKWLVISIVLSLFLALVLGWKYLGQFSKTPVSLPSPTAEISPTPTSLPTPVPCDTEVTVDDIPHIAPELAGGTPFGVTAEIICKERRPDGNFSVGLNFRSGSTFQWGIAAPGAVDLSEYGSVSFWLLGNQGGEELVFGVTDTNNHFAKHAISAASEWVNVIIPLSEFQHEGVDLHKVQNIFMDFEGPAEATVYVDQIAFVPSLTWEFRGVNLTVFSPDGYRSSETRALVDHFKQMGANCVAVLVTWYQDGQEATAIVPDLNRTPSDESLKEIIGYIHSQDMKVLLNLHVDDQHLERDYPKVDRWRGNFDPADSAQWFNSYREFVSHYAKLAEINQVDIVNIGSEQASLEASRKDVSHWMDLVRVVREEGYTGKLMYTMSRKSEADQQREDNLAALWKELDYVGTTVHFTLSEEAAPSVESLVQAWKQHAVALNDWAKTIQKPIIFTEVAYRSVDYCSKEPWRWRGDLGPLPIGEGEKCQQNAYEAFLQTFDQDPWLAGAFWWNYMPGSPSDYSPENKPADNVVHRWYGGLQIETVLRSPIPPVPAEAIYDLEAPPNMWTRPASSSVTTVSVTSKSRPETDNWILEWIISLAGEDEQRRQGEVLLDLRYSRVSDDDLASTTSPFSYRLPGKIVSCWVYVPGAPAGLTIQAFGKSPGISDSNWRSEYGSAMPVQGNEWFIVALTPDGISDTSGERNSDDVNSDFDPEHVIAIGLKVMAGEDSEYNGTLFIDACTWSVR